ncbi:MAG: hypothetical protein FWF66_02265 [Candidatus Bathyarchaeota archaeon]|nr:hypothetical protein [Candidatus Termiticorpusculum sp.]
MMACKKCDSENIVKSGIVGGRQRFRCKGCGCNFRIGDNRTDEKIAAKKALCILWYTSGKESYRMIGHILKVKHSLIYRWIHDFRTDLPEPKVAINVKEIEFDEVWHYFVGLKKNKLWRNHFHTPKNKVFNKEQVKNRKKLVEFFPLLKKPTTVRRKRIFGYPPIFKAFNFHKFSVNLK